MKPQKICTKCHKSKDKTRFSKDKKKPDGRSSHCKSCKNSYLKKRYEDNKDELLSDPVRRYHKVIDSAKRRNKEFNLTFEFYLATIQKDCYYCSKPVIGDKGIGLDRIDNSKGYLESNVLPCCVPCNFGRHLSFTVEEWKAAMDAIKRLRSDV